MNDFHKLEEECPYCGTDIIGGMYSATPPHSWFWLVGTGDTQEEIVFCPRCGKRLPVYKSLAPEQYREWYEGYMCYPHNLKNEAAS